MDSTAHSAEKIKRPVEETRLFRFGKRHPSVSSFINGLAFPLHADEYADGYKSALGRGLNRMEQGAQAAEAEARFGLFTQAKRVYSWVPGVIITSPLTLSMLLGHLLRDLPGLVRSIPEAAAEVIKD